MDDLFLKIDNLADTPENYYKMTVADILDTTGDKIGVWFSYYYYTVVKVNQDNNIIDVLNPYNPNDSKYDTRP
jgi:hypothetical protein